MDIDKLKQAVEDIENAIQAIQDIVPDTVGDMFDTLKQVEFDLSYSETLIIGLIEPEEEVDDDYIEQDSWE